MLPNMNAGLSAVVACDRRSSPMATRSTGMHARPSEAKIWTAQILMLWQAAGDSGGYALSPGDAMQNEENQPTSKCNQTAGNGDKHEPTHDAERVKQFAVIMSVDDARMH